MATAIYDKTDKGREEIATRKYHLSPRLRTLLVMVDGNLPLEALLKNLGGLGVNEASVQELLEQEYIVPVKQPEPEVVPAPAARPAPVTARARQLARRAAGAHTVGGDEPLEEDEQADLAAGPATLPLSPSAEPQVDEAERFRALYEFYNQTIKSQVGLRGMFLQLKMEKCSNIDDFRQLRTPYLEAILKARGKEIAMSLRDRLDHLLGGKPEHDEVELPQH